MKFENFVIRVFGVDDDDDFGLFLGELTLNELELSDINEQSKIDYRFNRLLTKALEDERRQT